MTNSAWLGDQQDISLLFASGRSRYLALGSSLGWATRSVGYVGQSDGYQQLVRHAKWEKHVFDAVAQLTAALEPDYVVIGGGNVAKLKSLPPNARRGDNANAFKGGFALWLDSSLQVLGSVAVSSWVHQLW